MAEPPPVRAVIFRVGDLICAAPAEIVREVLPRSPATRLPGTPAAVVGLVNVRGTLLTVLDGHVLLGRQPRPDDEGALVVIELGGRRFGLSVGQVVDLAELPANVATEGGQPPGIEPRIVRGATWHAGKLVAMLDVGALLAPVIGP